MQSEYQKYLDSEHWADFKRRYKNSDEPQQCVVCGDKNYHLHHLGYNHMYNEKFYDVLPLCEKHHLLIHKIHKQRKIPLENFGEALKHMLKNKKVARPSKDSTTVIEDKITDGYRQHLAAHGIDWKTGKQNTRKVSVKKKKSNRKKKKEFSSVCKVSDRKVEKASKTKQFFAFGEDIDKVYLISDAGSKNKFGNKIKKSGLREQCPMSRILVIDESKFNELKSIESIKVI